MKGSPPADAVFRVPARLGKNVRELDDPSSFHRVLDILYDAGIFHTRRHAAEPYKGRWRSTDSSNPFISYAIITCHSPCCSIWCATARLTREPDTLIPY